MSARGMGVGLLLCVACSSGGSSVSSSSSSGSTGSETPSGSSGTSTGCGAQAIPPAVSGGCTPRIVTPAACEEVDLRGGRAYELAWTADGTGCETPWKLCVGGNPVSDPNSTCVDLATDTSAGISRTGGVLRVTAADLQGLTSTDGVYHLLVASFYGSHAGSVAFRVQK